MKNKDQLSCKVIMLPTDKATKLYKIKPNDPESTLPDKLGILLMSDTVNGKATNQHLYITSSREIKEGDWYMLRTNIKGEFRISNNWDTCKHTFDKKIEASTDPSLGLPLIPQSFIEAYVKAEGKINEVMIEMESRYIFIQTSKSATQEELLRGTYNNGDLITGEYKDEVHIKTRKDNTIIIHQDRMYSRKEVKQKLEDYLSHIEQQQCDFSLNNDYDWINHNL